MTLHELEIARYEGMIRVIRNRLDEEKNGKRPYTLRLRKEDECVLKKLITEYVCHLLSKDPSCAIMAESGS